MNKEMPVTVRRAVELIGLYFLGVIVVAANGIITPLLMAFFISIVLLPVYRFFKKKGLPEVLSISLAILLLVVLVSGLIWFFSSQISNLIADFPEIKNNVTNHLNTLSGWIDRRTNLSTERQVQILNDQSKKLVNYAGGAVSGAAASL